MWFQKWWFSFFCLAIAIGFVFHKLRLNWPAIALIALGGIPFLTPIIARYISSIRKTKDGWECILREDIVGLSKDEISRQLRASEGSEENPTSLSEHAKRIIATLWFYQKDIFGEDNAQRWGFGVGRLSPEFATFNIGVKELSFARLIFPDPRGLVYLTDQGVAFCKTHAGDIANWRVYYNQFVAA